MPCRWPSPERGRITAHSAGSAEVDRQARRHQRGVAGLQRQRRVERGAQVQAGAGGGGVGRQRPFVAEARVEHLHFERAVHHAVAVASRRSAIRSSSASASCGLRRRAERALAVAASTRPARCRRSRNRCRRRRRGWRRSGRGACARACRARSRSTSSVSAAKPTTSARPPRDARATSARMSGVRTSSQRQRVVARCFLILPAATLRGREVGDRGGADVDVGRQRRRAPRRASARRERTSMRLHARRASAACTGPATSTVSAPGARRRRRSRSPSCRCCGCR